MAGSAGSKLLPRFLFEELRIRDGASCVRRFRECVSGGEFESKLPLAAQ
jgi:hypothetical protein